MNWITFKIPELCQSRISGKTLNLCSILVKSHLSCVHVFSLFPTLSAEYAIMTPMSTAKWFGIYWWKMLHNLCTNCRHLKLPLSSSARKFLPPRKIWSLKAEVFFNQSILLLMEQSLVGNELVNIFISSSITLQNLLTSPSFAGFQVLRQKTTINRKVRGQKKALISTRKYWNLG